VNQSQATLKEIVRRQPELDGLGSTLVLALGVGEHYIAANIGDSRLYHFQEGKLMQRSRDHSLVEQYRAENGREPDAAMVAQYGHMLTRSVSNNDDKPTIYDHDGKGFPLHDGEFLLLCSDGLILDKGMPAENWLLDKLRQHSDFESAVAALPLLAMKAGSTDNISLILAAKASVWPLRSGAVSQKVKGKPFKIPYILLMLLLILMSGALWLNFSRSKGGESPQKAKPYAENRGAEAVLAGRFMVKDSLFSRNDRLSWHFPKMTPQRYELHYSDETMQESGVIPLQQAFIRLNRIPDLQTDRRYYIQVMARDSLKRSAKTKVKTIIIKD
jgi:hypothetical protein